jgi:fumarylacetoacetase
MSTLSPSRPCRKRHNRPVSGFGKFDGRLGWRCGDDVLDLGAAGLLAGPLFAGGRAAWDRTVEQIVAAVEAGAEPRRPLAEVTLELPFAVGDFVDFYASLEHATAMGRIFRPETEPLYPNWRRVPIGYHGRAGTVVVSGTDIARPRGQLSETEFGPTQKLDVEVELGFVVGAHASSFRDAVFGVVLVNDWSARDIQAFESRPLGPFLGKSFATSISAWITPLALLEGARAAAPPQDPEPAEYLHVGRDWALDVALELEVNGEVLARPNARGLYWTGPQLLAHLTSNGTTLRAGDLLATGTISSHEPGSLIELGGPFLADGDEVVIRGGATDVELGEVRGKIRG